MKKKIIILLSISFGLVALMTVLMFTVFTVQKVEFNPLNENNYNTSEINVDKGGVVFFLNKKKMIENIEKTHPYVNVINIENIFPNKIKIHYATREETFAVKDYNKDVVYIIDDEMVVLRVENTQTYLSTQQNAILVENLVSINQTVNPGDILNVNFYTSQIDEKNNQQYFQNLISSLSDQMLYNGKDVKTQCAIVKKIYLEYDPVHFVIDGDGIVLNFVTFDDFLIKIYNPYNEICLKLQYMFEALPKCIPDCIDTCYLEILEDNNGKVFGKTSLK